MRWGSTIHSARPARITRARRAGVGAPNTSLTPTRLPRAELTRAATYTASSELPPQANKSECGPRTPTPRTSAITEAINSSSYSIGRLTAARCSAGADDAGSGSAERSVFPWLVTGNAAKIVTELGSMERGSREAR